MWAPVLITIVLAVPPGEREDRKRQIQEILRLAEGTTPELIASTIDRMQSKYPAWQRIVALKSLRAHHVAAAKPSLKVLVDDPDIHVRTEALIRLCQFAPSETLWKRLSLLRDRGVSLRRAFQSGEKKGRPTYRAGAAEFFVQSLSHRSIYTRLDGALGLIEIRQEPSLSVALDIFRKILESGTVNERRLVVHHMYTSFREQRFLPLIKMAQQDQDASVQRLANDLMKRQ